MPKKSPITESEAKKIPFEMFTAEELSERYDVSAQYMRALARRLGRKTKRVKTGPVSKADYSQLDYTLPAAVLAQKCGVSVGWINIQKGRHNK